MLEQAWAGGKAASVRDNDAGVGAQGAVEARADGATLSQFYLHMIAGGA